MIRICKLNLVFFALLSINAYSNEITQNNVSNIPNNGYVDTQAYKNLLKKMEEANLTKAQNSDQSQKELEELQKQVNLINAKRTLENADSSLGNNQENVSKRVKSIEKYYKETTSLNEIIYSNDFSYQSFCKGDKCVISAIVESEVFNDKVEKLQTKISSDKIAMAQGLQNIYPLEEKISLVKQIEQTTFSSNQMMNNLNMSNSINNDDTKKKKYLEVNDGDIIGNIKIKVTPNYIMLSKK